MKSVVCFGEVLWDMLPSGKKLGGAPFNVALRIQSFGNKAAVISAIGNDAQGKEIVDKIKSYSACIDHIQYSKKYNTSEVLVSLDKNGSASYEIRKPCAWDDIELIDSDIEAVKNADAFIYGSLSSRSETSKTTLLALLKYAKFKIFDVNLRAPHYTQGGLEELMAEADLIKLNDDEIVDICKEMGFKNDSMEENIRFIAQKTNTNQICVTRGENGAILYLEDSFYYNQGYKVEVEDTVGAGDSFLATVIDRLLKGFGPQKGIDDASAVGAIVASRSGANPKILNEEIESIQKQHCDAEYKYN